MRTILPLLIVLLVAGCAKAPSVPKLTPVVVDEAAAYPKQEAGTRPPVLTGVIETSEKNLHEGRIQLFDGVSTYGWHVTSGDAELTLKKRDGNNVLVCERKSTETTFITHRFFGFSKVLEGPIGKGEKQSFVSETKLDNGSHTGSVSWLFYIKEQYVSPQNPQPLAETDWKPVSGESEAAWSDDVLELTGGLGMVETVKEYGDFVLQLEYYTAATPEGGGVNSGVFFRCIPGETLNGYECQIFNNPPAEDYDKFIGTDTGGIFRRCVGRNVGPKDNEWNFLTIAVRGPMIATWVNGIQTVDWTDTRKEDENPRKGLRLKPGTIQLQGHDPGTKIKFRNFRIAEME